MSVSDRTDLHILSKSCLHGRKPSRTILKEKYKKNGLEFAEMQGALNEIVNSRYYVVILPNVKRMVKNKTLDCFGVAFY